MTTDDTTGPGQRPPKRRPDDAPPVGLRAEAEAWLATVTARDTETAEAASLIRRLLAVATPATAGQSDALGAEQRLHGDMAKLDLAAAAAHRSLDPDPDKRALLYHAVVLAAIPVVLGWADLTGTDSDARAAIDSDDAGSVAGDDD